MYLDREVNNGTYSSGPSQGSVGDRDAGQWPRPLDLDLSPELHLAPARHVYFPEIRSLEGRHTGWLPQRVIGLPFLEINILPAV